MVYSLRKERTAFAHHMAWRCGIANPPSEVLDITINCPKQSKENDMVKSLKICGIEYTIEEVEAPFNTGEFGEIIYKDCVIKVRKDLCDAIKRETIFHEAVHGIFVHLGYNDLCDNEQLVQALGNALSQSFDFKS